MWYAIILAGGSGTRMGANRNKVLLELQNEPVILRTIKAFSGLVEGVLLVSRKEDISTMEQLTSSRALDVTIVSGGNTRQESVWNGLCALPDDCTHVLIHDGARCMVDRETICRSMISAERYGTGVAAIPATDTIKQVDQESIVITTFDRNTLRLVQTPQAFSVDLIRRAHQSALQEGFLGTDDASLVERLGIPVRLTHGNRANIKLTTPEDLKMAEAFLGMPQPILRVGQGYDVHRLVEDRKLILCGVHIPHHLGLLGHSDADVAVHALMDAMLGAMALGDIGKHFPDSDNRYRGISSMKLLEHVVSLLHSKNAQVTNCDVTIIAQKPKLLPYIPLMRENIAKALNLPLDFVNVKATTTEHLSFEGREEGISAQAICMIQQITSIS